MPYFFLLFAFICYTPLDFWNLLTLFEFIAYKSSQVVTFLCSAQSNLGAVRSTAIPLVKQVLEPLCTTLVNSLKPDWHDSGAAAYYQ